MSTPDRRGSRKRKRKSNQNTSDEAGQMQNVLSENESDGENQYDEPNQTGLFNNFSLSNSSASSCFYGYPDDGSYHQSFSLQLPRIHKALPEQKFSFPPSAIDFTIPKTPPPGNTNNHQNDDDQESPTTPLREDMQETSHMVASIIADSPLPKLVNGRLSFSGDELDDFLNPAPLPVLLDNDSSLSHSSSQTEPNRDQIPSEMATTKYTPNVPPQPLRAQSLPNSPRFMSAISRSMMPERPKIPALNLDIFDTGETSEDKAATKQMLTLPALKCASDSKLEFPSSPCDIPLEVFKVVLWMRFFDVPTLLKLCELSRAHNLLIKSNLSAALPEQINLLRFGKKIPPGTMDSLIRDFKKSQVVKLNLLNCPVNSSQLGDILYGCRTLQALKIGCASPSVTRTVEPSIFKYEPERKKLFGIIELDFSKDRLIPDQAILQFVLQCPDLKHLSLRLISANDTFVEQLGINCPKLLTLSMRRCPELNLDNVVKLIQACPKLEMSPRAGQRSGHVSVSNNPLGVAQLWERVGASGILQRPDFFRLWNLLH